jgi:hypothetical protein
MNSPPAVVPSPIQPRFYQREMDSDIDNVIDEQADRYVNNMFNQTLVKLNGLKEELKELKRDDGELKQSYIEQYKSLFSEEVNNAKILNNTNNLPNDSNKDDKLSDIVNKYSINNLGDQFQLFNDAFRFVNTTSSAGINKYNLTDINEKIVGAVNTVNPNNLK